MFYKKRGFKWKDLSPLHKNLIIIGVCIQIVLLTAALIDISRRKKEEIRGSKIWWALGSFVDIVGPIVYFIFGRK